MSLKVVCKVFNYTRQGYYKHIHLEEMRKEQNEQVLSFVQEVRHTQTKVGTLKLHKMLIWTAKPILRIGRDRLSELLRDHKMLIYKKGRKPKTSIPNPSAPVYPNLLEGVKADYVNQAWVADITYLKTLEGDAYLFLLTDLYSRHIIGYKVASNMKAVHACQILKKAISRVSDPSKIIHHSDRGSQYSSKEYQRIISQYKMLPSMTGHRRCLDNPVAERVNGILKDEFGLSETLPSLKVAQELVSDAVDIYNCKRLHKSLQYNTPHAVYNAA